MEIRIIIQLFVLICGVSAVNVLPKIGVAAVARRRGHPRSWLVWLPFGHQHMLGYLADQHRSAYTNVRKSRRVLFMVLEVLRLPLFVGLMYGLISTVAAAFARAFVVIFTFGTVLLDPAFENEMHAYVVNYSLLSLGCLCMLLPSTIMRSVILLDYYRSCRPNFAVKYLVLGLIFPFLQPIFQFICRKEEDWMAVPFTGKPTQFPDLWDDYR